VPREYDVVLAPPSEHPRTRAWPPPPIWASTRGEASRHDRRDATMPAHWIRIEATTPDKPEVIAIAARLGLTENEVLGGLVRLWIWADQNCTAVTQNSNALSVTPASLDRIARATGIAEALLSPDVGWLLSGPEPGGVVFSNFDRHNGKSAKTRALSAMRQAKYRDKKSVTQKRNASSVTRSSSSSSSTPSPGGNAKGGKFTPPTVAEVREYCRERENNVDPGMFVDFYASKGWRVGTSPMRDWKCAVRNWERRAEKERPAGGSPDTAFMHNFLREQGVEGF
jgi:hypothetical protein